MTHRWIVTSGLALSCLVTCGAPLSPQNVTEPSETLVWEDQFDGRGMPDATRWDYEVGRVRNNERQYYTRGRATNARVEDGMLVIEAHRETFEGADYTSASLTSRVSWTYGRIEVRAKLPKGRGTWPAIWMLGTNIREVGWPMCGEIDIMEHVGFDPGRVHANIHTRAYNHVQRTNKGNSVQVSQPDGEFHVYEAVWTPNLIDVRVDGRQYFTFAKEPGGDAVWPFDKPRSDLESGHWRKLGRSAGHRRLRFSGAFPDRLRAGLPALTRNARVGMP